MAVRLTVLNDNRGAPGLLNEWGWSVLVEAGGMSVLFDADSKPEVLHHNTRELGVDLSRVSFAVLSHEHWDHYGGMPFLAEQKPGVTVHVPPGLHLWAKGLEVELRYNSEGGRIEGPFSLTRPFLVRALALAEHAMLVDTGSERVLVVGCSHPGIDRLAEEASHMAGGELTLVIGGFHRPSTRQLDAVARLSRFIAPAHCSGDEAVEYVAREYPGRLVLVRTGSIVRVGGGGVEVEG